MTSEERAKNPEATQGGQTKIFFLKKGIFEQTPQVRLYRLTLRDSTTVLWTLQDSLKGSHLDIQGIPVYNNVHFNLTLLDSNQTPLYTCNSPKVNITAGPNTLPTLLCDPQFSEIKSTLSLIQAPFNKIDSGLLTLTPPLGHTYTSPMKLMGRMGQFNLSGLPGNVQYKVRLQLFQGGKLKFQNDSNTLLLLKTGESKPLTLTLNAVEGNATITLSTPQEPIQKIQVLWSGSQRRSPQTREIRFTELHPTPASAQGGNDAEWLELTNLTLDTLNLQSCQISRSRSSTATSTRQALDSLRWLLPGGTLVLGKDSSFSHWPLSLQLVDTKMTLLLLCDKISEAVPIDSINYSSSASLDTLEIALGRGTQLDLTHAHLPFNKAHWYPSIYQGDTLFYKPTPGYLEALPSK